MSELIDEIEQDIAVAEAVQPCVEGASVSSEELSLITGEAAEVVFVIAEELRGVGVTFDRAGLEKVTEAVYGFGYVERRDRFDRGNGDTRESLSARLNRMMEFRLIPEGPTLGETLDRYPSFGLRERFLVEILSHYSRGDSPTVFALIRIRCNQKLFGMSSPEY